MIIDIISVYRDRNHVQFLTYESRDTLPFPIPVYGYYIYAMMQPKFVNNRGFACDVIISFYVIVTMSIV